MKVGDLVIIKDSGSVWVLEGRGGRYSYRNIDADNWFRITNTTITGRPSSAMMRTPDGADTIIIQKNKLLKVPEGIDPSDFLDTYVVRNKLINGDR